MGLKLCIKLDRPAASVPQRQKGKSQHRQWNAKNRQILIHSILRLQPRQVHITNIPYGDRTQNTDPSEPAGVSLLQEVKKHCHNQTGGASSTHRRGISDPLIRRGYSIKLANHSALLLPATVSWNHFTSDQPKVTEPYGRRKGLLSLGKQKGRALHGGHGPLKQTGGAGGASPSCKIKTKRSYPFSAFFSRSLTTPGLALPPMAFMV